MKIVVLRGTMTSAGNARSGHVIELPDEEAKLMIRNGRASKFIETKIIEEINRSIGLESSDEKQIKRRVKAKKQSYEG